MKSHVRKNICCPTCKGSLDNVENGLVCKHCNHVFPVINGRPVLVSVDDSQVSLQHLMVESAKKLKFKTSSDGVMEGVNVDVKSYFFSKLFPKLNRRDPHWNFLAKKVSEMRASISNGTTILDVGAGDGRYGHLFSECDYISADLVFSSEKHDFTMIDVLTDAQNLGFSDDSVDVVLNMVVMEHVPNPSSVLGEISRVLKNGGKLYALIPLVRPEHLVPYDFYRYTRYAIKNLLNENGFSEVEIVPSNGSLWTAVHYASNIVMTDPLKKYGRRNWLGMLLNRFWWVVMWPLREYARATNSMYGDDFPIYFWVEGIKFSANEKS